MNRYEKLEERIYELEETLEKQVQARDTLYDYDYREYSDEISAMEDIIDRLRADLREAKEEFEEIQNKIEETHRANLIRDMV